MSKQLFEIRIELQSPIVYVQYGKRPGEKHAAYPETYACSLISMANITSTRDLGDGFRRMRFSPNWMSVKKPDSSPSFQTAKIPKPFAIAARIVAGQSGV